MVELGYVAGGEDVGVAGSQGRVGHHAIADRQAGIRREFHVGPYADADDHEGGGKYGPVGEFHGIDAVAAMQRLHRASGQDAHTVGLVQVDERQQS